MAFHEKSPSGRRNGLLWALSVLAFVLVAVLCVAIAYMVAKHDPKADADRAVTSTVTVTPSTRPPISTPAPSPTVTQPIPVPPVTETTTAQPTGSAVVLGGSCLESEASTFGTAADGTSLVCTYLGAGGGYQWVRHAQTDGEIHNVGDPCDSSGPPVSETPDGKAIICVSDGTITSWQYGP